MKIYDETTDFRFQNTAVTLGKFDGLHLGHRRLIDAVMDGRKQAGYETVLFSFDTAGLTGQKSINTRREKMALCEKMGLDHLVFFPVNEQTMSMEPETFIEKILVEKMGARLVVTGEDFRFGRQRKGDTGLLARYGERYGYRLAVQESVMSCGQKVSSTGIRRYLQEGELDKANRMLGYSYFMEGTVVRGNQIGRTMDTRTINLIPDREKFTPVNGVYKTVVWTGGQQLKGITNIGLCPTVRQDERMTVETHLFDFDGNLYDQEVKIEFIKFIRKERKFENLDALKRQISLDILSANL